MYLVYLMSFLGMTEWKSVWQEEKLIKSYAPVLRSSTQSSLDLVILDPMVVSIPSLRQVALDASMLWEHLKA